jgi:hypothetical protein
MSSRINDVLFSEPGGRLNAFVMFGNSLLMVSIYVYYDVLRDGSSIFVLIMAVGFALSGAAEFLPAGRRQLAGGLRVTAILLLIGLLGLTVFAPELVLHFG